ncbi:MAG: glycosyltransferase family 4 protein [Solirubrobacteraceae bacterium]|nr:MAG: hypothetical protein DLM63_08460 [Solirubrobacterales bacterium]
MDGPRLLAVAAVDEPGGAEIGLLRLLAGMAGRGWQITLTSPSGGTMQAAARAGGWDWAPLALGGLGRGAGLRSLAAWPRARRLAAAHDVVYLNGTVCGRLLPALRGQRCVLHVHDIIAHPPPRHWRAAAVVLADSAAAAAPLNGLDAHVVFCPVDPDPPPVATPWPAGDGPRVGFVGRIELRKGVLDLVRATPAIHAARPDARILIIGADPYGSDPAYLEAVRSAPGVEHYAWVPGAAGLLGELDVLVAPSHLEPFGTVLAEAMAVGTPVVATAVGGLPEVVEDGVSGRLVQPGDPRALAAAVLDVLDHRERMGGAARERARRFHTAAYVERVADLIGEGRR